MADYLIDANVLIGVFRGQSDLETFVEGLFATINASIYIELIQGAKNNISRRTIDLIRSYSKSHGLLLGDAIIAATCLENSLALVTFNAKDFRFIKGLKIIVPKL